jgi:predicted ester cyclase
MHNLLPADVMLAVIPTVTALTIRHFRHAKDDEGEHELEPKHPAVRFLLDAWNEGDLSDAHEHVAPDCEVYTNGLALEGEHAGPAMVRQAVESWRAMVPDLTMELAQEVGDKDRIAIEFRITGTHTGEAPEVAASGAAIDVEGSAFLTLHDDKIVEAWTVFDSLTLAVQMGSVEAPTWWPGRR